MQSALLQGALPMAFLVFHVKKKAFHNIFPGKGGEKRQYGGILLDEGT